MIAFVSEASRSSASLRRGASRHVVGLL